MLICKKYDENEKIERAWYDSSNCVYSEMKEDEFENKGDLTIMFKNGSKYKYKEVIFEDYVLLVCGGTDISQGKTLNKIIKGKYEFEKLNGPDSSVFESTMNAMKAVLDEQKEKNSENLPEE